MQIYALKYRQQVQIVQRNANACKSYIKLSLNIF